MQSKNEVLTAQIAAMYWGCKARVNGSQRSYNGTITAIRTDGIDVMEDGSMMSYKNRFQDIQLLLSPLSKISYEKALELLEHLNISVWGIDPIKEVINCFDNNGANEVNDRPAPCVMYKSYRWLCQHGFDMDNLIPRGIAVEK